MKNTIIRSAIIVLSLTAFFITAHSQATWTAPAAASGVKNPTPANKDNVATGKDLYAKHCKSCHGAAGLGDGPKAATLDVSCGDFTAKAFQAQTDGDLFYKVTEGKGKMPAFKKNIPDDKDRWALVNYMRTFKK